MSGSWKDQSPLSQYSPITKEYRITPTLTFMSQSIPVPADNNMGQSILVNADNKILTVAGHFTNARNILTPEQSLD